MVDKGSNPGAVDLGAFEDMIDRFGSDPGGWPAADRKAMRAFAETSEAARALLAQAKWTEDLIAAPPALRASPELVARVLAQAFDARPGVRRRIRAALIALWPFGPVWRPAATLCAAAALGVVIGLVSPPVVPANDLGNGATDDMVILAYGGDAELEDLE